MKPERFHLQTPHFPFEDVPSGTPVSLVQIPALTSGTRGLETDLPWKIECYHVAFLFEHIPFE